MALGFEGQVERLPGRELGRLLGYGRERDFYPLVKRLARGRPDFGVIHWRDTASRQSTGNGGSRSYTAKEPMLTERQAVLAAISADTDAAWRVKALVVDVFLAVRRVARRLRR